jgi:two-component sensor histidine kinase
LNIYTVKFRWKLLLFVLAVIIGVGSLWYTRKLVRKLADEERKKVELWAEAQSKILMKGLSEDLMSFFMKVIKNNETVPVILVDKDDNIITYRNLNPKKADNPRYLRRKLMQMKEQKHIIEIELPPENEREIYINAFRNLFANVNDSVYNDIQPRPEKSLFSVDEYITGYLECYSGGIENIALNADSAEFSNIYTMGPKKYFTYVYADKSFSGKYQGMQMLKYNRKLVFIITFEKKGSTYTGFKIAGISRASSSIINESPIALHKMKIANITEDKLNEIYLHTREMLDEYTRKLSLLGSPNQYLYYSKSIILIKLTYYPYVQLGVILLFILVSYFAFSYSRKAEQNQVWVGLSKETAHQLGTPISSLLAWLEMMKLKSPDKEMLAELEKDIMRLEKITGRFSKIGSKPLLRKENIQKIITTTINYLKSRSSDKITFKLDVPAEELNIPLNGSLFEWVIENVCKNAIDAVNGTGEITLSITDHTQVIYIDISDSGKGISKSKFKTIFKPGYTTKERGWGLGLSLTKRIIEEYHDGKIFVYESEIGKGTVIRIVLKK